MKRAFLLLLPAVLLVFLGIAGCNDSSLPTFTRVRVYPSCGVVPLQVEGLAIASGGDESGSPTGGNNNLEISWNFGDGTTSQTSIAYHTFNEPGEYTVVVSATDPEGNVAASSYPVTVLADSLNIVAFSNFTDGMAAVTDTILFSLLAEACDIDPLVEGDYVKMEYLWTMEDQTFTGRNPMYQFSTPGEYQVFLAVTYPTLAVTRHDTLDFTVTGP